MRDGPTVGGVTLEEQLATFVEKAKFNGKGPLCVALVITDMARKRGFPLDSAKLLTNGGGQVLGLGKGAVQAILTRHGISKTLASEGGRTSRGSIANMHAYVEFLNKRGAQLGFDIEAVESFWIAQVREFFAAKPFTLRLDAALSLRSVIHNVMAQAEVRQRDMQGTMIVGTVMQHMTGAKLDLVMGGGIEHHSANQNDAGSGRTGDFEIGDVSIHVTASAGEALIAKCRDNIDQNRKPIIITSRDRVATAEGLADNSGILSRVEIIDFEQFVATNLHEISKFTLEGRRVSVADLVTRYNDIIDNYETDPSLRIEVA